MLIYKKSLIVLVVVAVAGLAGTMYGYWQRDGETVAMPQTAAPLVTETEPDITVYVAGAVNRPGVVSLRRDTRVVDAVNECGGTLPTADLERINMAELLKDGQKIVVPAKATDVSDTTPSKPSAVQAPTANVMPTETKNAKDYSFVNNGEKVNINTADERLLDTLPGVGAATAKKIIEYREAHGAFSRIEDIKKVRGIGEGKFQKMKDMITT